MDRPLDPNGNDPEIMTRRASSFGTQAAVYADHRPGYPGAAVRWALEPVAARPPRVLDLAAGTGKLTEVLVRCGAEVVAVEPDAAMLAELRRRVPRAEALAGTAEEIPLNRASVDAIVIGQALHWFDLDRAVPEMARVLTDGGVLAAFWNLDDDRVPWVRGLKEVSRSSVSISKWRLDSVSPPGPGFPVVEHAEFPHAQRRTAQSMATTIGTHSHLLVLSEAERSRVLARIGEYLRSRPETASGEFELPIVTKVIRCVRAPAGDEPVFVRPPR